MLPGAIGASAVSQLYQGLTSPKTTANTPTQVQGPGDGLPPSEGPSQSGSAGNSISAASAKVVADLKALLLGVQAGTSGTGTGTGTTAGTQATGSGSDLASDLATLLGDLKKAGGHHGHGRPSVPPPDNPPPGTDAGSSPGTGSASNQDLLAVLTKGINAYAASLNAGTTSTASISA